MEHRLLLQAIAMTASDLSASAKPWDLQVETVKVIFEEFYEQGDAEKLAGQMPSPLMDRDKKCDLADIQVGFLTSICIPCYSLLHQLIPETKPLLDQCHANLARWRKIDEEDKLRRAQGLLQPVNDILKGLASQAAPPPLPKDEIMTKNKDTTNNT